MPTIKDASESAQETTSPIEAIGRLLTHSSPQVREMAKEIEESLIGLDARTISTACTQLSIKLQDVLGAEPPLTPQERKRFNATAVEIAFEWRDERAIIWGLESPSKAHVLGISALVFLQYLAELSDIEQHSLSWLRDTNAEEFISAAIETRKLLERMAADAHLNKESEDFSKKQVKAAFAKNRNILELKWACYESIKDDKSGGYQYVKVQKFYDDLTKTEKKAFKSESSALATLTKGVQQARAGTLKSLSDDD